MSKKNIFLLAAGYVLGGIVSSVYSKKKPGELKKELAKAKAEQGDYGDFKVLLNNFVETHKNLIKDIEGEIMSEKNKALFNEKKEELLNIANTYKSEGEKLLSELKEKGKGFLVEASDKLEMLYNEKKDQIDQFKEVSPEKVKELKNNLLASFNEIKEEIKKEIEESKKEK